MIMIMRDDTTWKITQTSQRKSSIGLLMPCISTLYLWYVPGHAPEFDNDVEGIPVCVPPFKCIPVQKINQSKCTIY